MDISWTNTLILAALPIWEASMIVFSQDTRALAADLQKMLWYTQTHLEYIAGNTIWENQLNLVEEDVTYLRNDVQVGDKGALENDGDVGGVEQFDGVWAVLATVTSRLDGQVYTEALQTQQNQVKTGFLMLC